MATSIYHINKGINQSITFKGLRAQYIWYFAGMVIILLLAFAVFYIAGVSIWLCLVIIGSLGAFGCFKIFNYSHKYGEHGLMKELARRTLPKVLKSGDRLLFQSFINRF